MLGKEEDIKEGDIKGEDVKEENQKGKGLELEQFNRYSNKDFITQSFSNKRKLSSINNGVSLRSRGKSLKTYKKFLDYLIPQTL